MMSHGNCRLQALRLSSRRSPADCERWIPPGARVASRPLWPSGAEDGMARAASPEIQLRAGFTGVVTAA